MQATKARPITLVPYCDRAGHARWRATSSNGKNIGSSGEHFASWDNAIRAARRLPEILRKPSTKLKVYTDTGSEWRWRVKAANNHIIASSGESFDSFRNAVAAGRNFCKRIRDGKVVIRTGKGR